MKIWHILAGIGVAVFFVRLLTSRKSEGSGNLAIALIMRVLSIGLVFFVIWLIELVTGQ